MPWGAEIVPSRRSSFLHKWICIHNLTGTAFAKMGRRIILSAYFLDHLCLPCSNVYNTALERKLISLLFIKNRMNEFFYIQNLAQH
ncbi:MAG TPA: hypothetical protein DCS42_15620 [Nitrospiraceae bacterium]|nr:hypothetical protein [Nitrospiraceae bacterium]HAS55451.1 hypothetical protein [Nitrospiraceae bacterium]